MDIYASVTKVAQLIGDPRRATILMTLVDGQAWPAGDLAQVAGISPSTASDHLGQLVAGGLLTVVQQGRHRYYRIANSGVAQIMESLASVAPPGPIRSLRQSDLRKALQYARTCYDHVAGYVGVAITEAGIQRGYWNQEKSGYGLTDAGLAWLQEIGVPCAAGHLSIPTHIDWTERTGHLAGPLSVRLTARLFELGWFTRGTGTTTASKRTVVVTEAGKDAFRQHLGLEFRNTRS